MTANNILYIIIGITIFDFVTSKLLGILNNKSSKQPVPENLKDIYEEDKYIQSQKYQSEVFNFSTLSSIISFMTMITILWMGGFGWLDSLVRTFTNSDMLVSLYFFGILYFVSDIINTPWELYSTFVIEEKYGFNKMTAKTFIMDKLKGWLIAIILGGLIGGIFLVLVDYFQQEFWIYFWIVISVFMVFINIFYTSLFIPLFNKLTPLEDGTLKEAITKYSESVGFPLNNIFVIDGSKRSSKGNAFFSGLGKKKKVVLYDTLIDNHSEEELVGVLAHEVGHFKKKHIIYSMVLGILQTGVMLWVLSSMLFNPEVSIALGANQIGIHLNILAFGTLFSPISMIVGILMNLFSRKNEYEADEYAVRTYAKAPLISALKKLTSDSLGNLTPHPWYVFVNYSHPSLQQRIEAMDAVE